MKFRLCSRSGFPSPYSRYRATGQSGRSDLNGSMSLSASHHNATVSLPFSLESRLLNRVGFELELFTCVSRSHPRCKSTSITAASLRNWSGAVMVRPDPSLLGRFGKNSMNRKSLQTNGNKSVNPSSPNAQIQSEPASHRLSYETRQASEVLSVTASKRDFR